MSEVFAIPLCKVVNFSLKAKLLKFNSEAGQKWGLFCFTFLFVFLMIIGNSATAQVETPIKSLPGKLPVKGDSIRPDTLIRPKKDTVHIKSDTLKNVKKKGAIETTILYSARDSIIRAAKMLSNEPLITRELFSKALGSLDQSAQAAPDVDLLIRTGGEQRLSDFLLWESAYAELYFTQTMWPDFGEKELSEALSVFHSRDRRFGRVSTPNEVSNGKKRISLR